MISLFKSVPLGIKILLKAIGRRSKSDFFFLLLRISFLSFGISKRYLFLFPVDKYIKSRIYYRFDQNEPPGRFDV